MTLSEIERAAGVPADLIIKELGLPPDVEQTERLGRLRRTYGFAIEDVRRIIQSHQKDRRKAPSR
jgi:glutamyl-tRNA reductase